MLVLNTEALTPPFGSSVLMLASDISTKLIETGYVIVSVCESELAVLFINNPPWPDQYPTAKNDKTILSGDVPETFFT